MLDNEFSPDRVEVSEGETVRFVFTNEGQATHDAVVGDEAAQAEHEAEMRSAESESEHGSMSTMGHGSEAEGSGAAITDHREKWERYSVSVMPPLPTSSMSGSFQCPGPA